MPCYSPLSGYYSAVVNPSGKRSVVFDVSKADISKGIVQVPCGQCIGCRLERSRQWAVRCVHESKMHKDNCFVTLTYRPLFMHKDRSLHLEDFQKFMKRLRKRFGKVRFFHCGEYGSKLNRPHYHACLFGFDFPDKKLWKVRNGVRLYRSKELERLWYYGFSCVGDVTFESAAYVARYVTKKVTNKEDYYDKEGCLHLSMDKHYRRKKPEYVTMSRNPGLASAWFDKFHSDVYPNDYLVVRGEKCKPVRFYDNKYDLTNSESFALIKEARKNLAALNPDNRPRRLRVREKVKLANFASLKRGFEDGTSSV